MPDGVAGAREEAAVMLGELIVHTGKLLEPCALEGVIAWAMSG